MHCLHSSRVGMTVGEGFLMGGQNSSGTNFCLYFGNPLPLAIFTHTLTHSRTNAEWREHFFSPSLVRLFVLLLLGEQLIHSVLRILSPLPRYPLFLCHLPIRREFSLVFFTLVIIQEFM